LNCRGGLARENLCIDTTLYIGSPPFCYQLGTLSISIDIHGTFLTRNSFFWHNTLSIDTLFWVLTLFWARHKQNATHWHGTLYYSYNFISREYNRGPSSNKLIWCAFYRKPLKESGSGGWPNCKDKVRVGKVQNCYYCCLFSGNSAVCSFRFRSAFDNAIVVVPPIIWFQRILLLSPLSELRMKACAIAFFQRQQIVPNFVFAVGPRE